MKIYKLSFIFFPLFLSSLFLSAQEVGFGVGIQFSPWETKKSTTEETKISEDKVIEKIIQYFYGNITPTEKTDISTEDGTEQHSSQEVLLSTTVQHNISQIKKLSTRGFGRMEIIRLILIYEKSHIKGGDIKPILDMRKKGKSFKEIAEKFNVDYTNDVWLESKRIYNKILNEKL